MTVNQKVQQVEAEAKAIASVISNYDIPTSAKNYLIHELNLRTNYRRYLASQ